MESNFAILCSEIRVAEPSQMLTSTEVPLSLPTIIIRENLGITGLRSEDERLQARAK
jgi:hypothetical protein